LLIWAGLACGYRLSDPKQVFGPDVRRIRIELLENKSAEPGFERMLGDALVEEFTRRGVLVPVYGRGPGLADLILSGVVREVEVIPSAFSSASLALEDTLNVTVELTVANAATREDVWRRNTLHVSERFVSSADPNTAQSNKELALLRVSASLAGRIHDELFQKF